VNSRITWIGLAVVCALALALWLVRRPSAEDPAKAASAPSGAAVDRPALAHAAAAAPAPAAQGSQAAPAAAPQAGIPDWKVQAAADNAARAGHVNPKEHEFIAKLFELPGPDATPQQRAAWEESPVSKLLYPQGHPCAGQPIDSASPAVLTQAADEALDKAIGRNPEVDQPQCVFEGKWPFSPLNLACSSVNRDNPQSVAQCSDFLLGAPQDPNAYPATIWLPCSAGSGVQPTTLRQYYQQMVSTEVQHIFSGPACQPG